MKLNIKQFESICLGAVSVEETESGIFFHRFTSEQEELYKKVDIDFYRKSLASAGVKLSFETNSAHLFLKVNVTAASARRYFP